MHRQPPFEGPDRAASKRKFVELSIVIVPALGTRSAEAPQVERSASCGLWYESQVEAS